MQNSSAIPPQCVGNARAHFPPGYFLTLRWTGKEGTRFPPGHPTLPKLGAYSCSALGTVAFTVPPPRCRFGVTLIEERIHDIITGKRWRDSEEIFLLLIGSKCIGERIGVAYNSEILCMDTGVMGSLLAQSVLRRKAGYETPICFLYYI